MVHWAINLKGGPRNNYHAAVVVGHKLYSFGGYNNYLNYRDPIEVHIFNTLSLRWRKLHPVTNGRGQGPTDLVAQFGQVAVLVEDVVYIWGGCYDYSNVLYAFDVDTHSWFKPNISGTIPEARRFHSTCVLEKVVYVHGGRIHGTELTNDMYKLDTDIMVWTLINTRGTPPPASEGHSATIIGTKMFVFGGFGGSGVSKVFYNSIRVFDTETNCWLNTPSAQLLPEERSCHSAFAYNGELYILGGVRYVKSFNDLWKFSPETFCWKQVEPKGKASMPMHDVPVIGMNCCMLVGDRIIIHGEYKENNVISGDLNIIDLNPSLKMLCKLAVTQHGLEQSELPNDIRWELAAMTTNSNRNK